MLISYKHILLSIENTKVLRFYSKMYKNMFFKLIITKLSLKGLSLKRSQSLSVGFGDERFLVSESLTKNLSRNSKRKIALKSTTD